MPSDGERYAVTTLPVLSMTPAVRIQTWIGRTVTAVNVSVRSAACDSDTVVPVGFGRVRERTPCPRALVAMNRASSRNPMVFAIMWRVGGDAPKSKGKGHVKRLGIRLRGTLTSTFNLTFDLPPFAFYL